MKTLEFKKQFSELLIQYCSRIQAEIPEIQDKKRNRLEKERFQWSPQDEEAMYVGQVLSRYPSYKQEALDLQKVMSEAFPEYEGKMISINRGSATALRVDVFFPMAVNEVFNRKSKDIKIESVVNELVDEFFYFLKNEKVDFVFYAPLVGFNDYKDHDLSPMQLNEKLVIRKLTEAELSDCIEKGIATNIMSAFFPEAHRYGIVAEISFDKVLSDGGSASGMGLLKKTDELSVIENVIFALRVFKNGAVSCNHFFQKRKRFIPVLAKAVPTNQFYSPFYSYEMTREEGEKFSLFFKHFSSNLDRNLILACRKLNEINKTTDLFDRLLDSVVGLEAILLSSLGENENKGELRYRFSMNYASLFPKEQRIEKFNLAKKVYQSRNRLVHANHISEEKLNEMRKDSIESTEMLRHVIHEFLVNGEKPDYLKEQFWEKKILES